MGEADHDDGSDFVVRSGRDIEKGVEVTTVPLLLDLKLTRNSFLSISLQ